MRQAREIEYAFLGCIFDSPAERIIEAFDVGAKVEWFSEVSCQLVWTAIESLKKKTQVEKIKPLVIIAEAGRIASRKKSPFYGQKITSAFLDEAKKFRASAEEDEETTIAAYAPILKDAAIGRQLDNAMSASKIDTAFSSNAARMNALAKQIQTIQKDESLETDIDIGDLLDNMTAAYDKGYEEFAVKHNYNYVPGIPYPWDCVSRMTKGLTPGLHIIAARPSVGKTSFVLQCINYWCALGYKVAFDCLDMSVTEMIKRPVANLAWVSPTRMEFGWATPEEQRRVREATKTVRDMSNAGLLSLTLEPDVDKLKAWAEIRRAAGKLDILVIDFAQRFRLKGSSSEYEIVTYAAGVLKQLANECLIPVILLSQLSRDNVKDPNGKRPPELSDLRGSGALEQDATSVVLMHKVSEVNAAWRNEYPMYFVQESDDPRVTHERASSIAAVCWNLAKNQNGPIGEIPFVSFQNCFRWYVGDEDAEKADMYHKIQADWRFLEEPFLTAAQNGAVVYPDYWEQKCAETCGKLGVELPLDIKLKLKSWDLERYAQLRAEHDARIAMAKEASATPLKQAASAPPSMASIAASSSLSPEDSDITEFSAPVPAADHTRNEDCPTKPDTDTSSSLDSINDPMPEDELEDEFF